MKRLKLKRWVIPTVIFTLTVLAVVGVYTTLQNKPSEEKSPERYVINPVVEETEPVVSTNTNTMIKPYESDKVSISKNYYEKDKSEDEQQKSLIYYENIYMQNTGILYSSDEEFNVISVTKGVVKNIKEDELLGFIVEIENEELGLTSIYKSVDNISVKMGDSVEQGQIIATSGNNALSEEKDNCLHFETLLKGVRTNPLTLYDVDLNSLG